MTVIAADFVPVNAYTVDSLFLGIGQRYDVTLDASKPIDNYWFNVTFGGQNFCGSSNNPKPAAIFHYVGASGGRPTSPGVDPVDAQCNDLINLTPVITRAVATSRFIPDAGNTLPVTLDGPPTSPLFVWKVNGASINVDWTKPVVEYILEGDTSYPASENIVSVDQENQWVYWLISNDPDAAFSLPVSRYSLSSLPWML
jgi:hypothetical protein